MSNDQVSAFDPDVFMNTQFNDANATKPVVCPPGEYRAQLTNVKTRALPKGSIVMDVSWEVLDDAVKASLGMKPDAKLYCRHDTIWLDFDNGMLAFGDGQNVSLGRLRDALNQNTKGQPWAPSMLKGGVAKIKVAHEVNKDNGDIYAKAVAVSKLN